jgi:putative effector of murein hydrolase
MVRKGQQFQQHMRRNTIGHLSIDIGKILFGAAVVVALPILMENVEIESQTMKILGSTMIGSVFFWMVGCLIVR